ncbi:hypothetical protein C7M84_009807 [Penaeus vannamei]|uniref:Uncharacterized protein n=1 Tax=Penaeus vannamei TaxID=6689 RepID=A0A3R7Q9C6_PENVA|nr:hypothetical protein C7M84_009807 [Penaeus vannamei]
MAVYLVAPVVYQLQESLRHVDFRSVASAFDVRSWVGQLDFEKVGLATLVIVAAVLVFDWFNKNYAPNGPNLLVSSPPFGMLQIREGLNTLIPTTGPHALARHQSAALGAQERIPFTFRCPHKKMASNALAPVMFSCRRAFATSTSGTSSTTTSATGSQDGLQDGGLRGSGARWSSFWSWTCSPRPHPFGRSLVSSAAHAWDSTGQTGLSQSLRGSRSLEPVATVLDALAEAVKKWEAQEEGVVRNRAL